MTSIDKKIRLGKYSHDRIRDIRRKYNKTLDSLEDFEGELKDLDF